MNEAKKALGKLLKLELASLVLPGELKKKTSTKMNLEATLTGDWSVFIGCADVKGSREKQAFGLYWLLSLSDGPVLKIMESLALDKAPGFSGNVIFRATSHNLQPERSHYEANSKSDLESIAEIIRSDLERTCLPIISAFCVDHRKAVDFILDSGASYVRNPFTAAVILLGLANDFNAVDEVVSAAGTSERFYDFHRVANPNSEIVQPILNWFELNRKYSSKPENS
ncbi:MAG: hypothetical protein KDA72_03195 [Planctomycetales bacterium]|nr:hypothetical protein [Planctomycetales bacterium]